MTKPLRIGLVGGGAHSAIGPSHIAALRIDGKFDIAPSLFSQDEKRNQESHEFYGLPWVGGKQTFDAWLNQYGDELDLVALLTPSPLHAAQIAEIAARGISFVSEKPVACSALEIQEIEKVVRQNHEIEARFVHNYSGYPVFRELVLRLEEGQIGKVHSLRIEMPSDGFARQKITGNPQLWRQADPDIPMIMLDLGTHMHHLVRMAIGRAPARVSARMQQLVNSNGVIDNVEIWEERSDGISVSYWMSKAHLGVKNGLRIEIFGSDGALFWYQMDPDHLVQVDMSSSRKFVNRGEIRAEAAIRDRFKPGHPTGFVEAFGNFYSDLAENVRSAQDGASANRWIRPIHEAFDGIRFLDAATRAHRTGNWVDI